MILAFKDAGIFLWGLNYALGELSRDLTELEAAGLLAGGAATLAEIGYRHSLSLGPQQTFLQISGAAARRSLAAAGAPPQALLFQHASSESATLPWGDPSDPDASTRYSYFAPFFLRELGLDHLPYFSLFESGCAGFALLIVAVGGLFLSSPETRLALCVMGDRRPDDASLDLYRERMLMSEHASSFVVGKESKGYQILGVNWYSTGRTAVPLLELVKRTVQMITGLCRELSVDISAPEVLVHYPNIFPDAWKMVSRSLRHHDKQHVMLDMPERAHCGGSDTIISLSKLYQGLEGRLHVVVTYGSGVHLAVAVLREKARPVA